MSQPSGGVTRTRQRKLRSFGFLLIALVAASVAFRILNELHLEHTSLVFIGLPALLAWIVAAAEPPGTAAGSVMRTTTLALLVAWIFLGEAFICVLMAAPIFYAVGGLVALVKKLRAESRAAGLLAVMLVPLALEGTSPRFSTSRERDVVVEATVPADIQQVRARLAATQRVDRELPLFFKLGFPTPIHPNGEGLHVGAQRSIHFAHGGHHSGMLVLEVVESRPTLVRFSAVSDDSYLTHWLSWREAVVELEKIAADRTHVRWTLRYARRLDPSWYFDPLEKYGVTLAGRYLLETLTTPSPAPAPQ
jgi:hypothetical protein